MGSAVLVILEGGMEEREEGGVEKLKWGKMSEEGSREKVVVL